jgi:environmental stress-induced protein Ves
MTPQLRRWIDVAAQPWRNGAGTTRELLAWPPGDSWRVRVSVADVDNDGSFSSYPGVLRWFTVLQGAGVELTVDGRLHRLQRGDPPFAFAGDAATVCRLLDGPTHDLNLMLRAASGSMLAALDGAPWSPAAAQCGLYTAVAGRCRADDTEVTVPAQALLWFEQAPRRLAFDADEQAAAPIGWWLAATPVEEPQ